MNNNQYSSFSRLPSWPRLSQLINQVVLNAFLIVIALAFVFPLLVVVSASLTTEDALARNGYSLTPSEFSLTAYKYIFTDPQKITNAYSVSIVVTILGTIGSLFCVSLLAYPLSRLDFKYRTVVSFIVFFTMLFSGGMIASYIWMTRYLNLKDSIFALILPSMVAPWFVFLMRSYFSTLPREFIEAAKIDGASEWQILFRIILPLSTPALATVGLFCILNYWNDWYGPMLYIRKTELYPLQYLLYTIMKNAEFVTSKEITAAVGLIQAPLQTIRMAMVMVAMGPITIVFMFLQRYFVRGITMGGIKS
jgi:putative aldouronate transport system permease protein